MTLEEGLARDEHLTALAFKAPWPLQDPAPPLAPDLIPDVVPTIAATAASAITSSMLNLPWLAATEAAIKPVSPGTGTPLDSAITTKNRSG